MFSTSPRHRDGRYIADNDLRRSIWQNMVQIQSESG